jgi:hypothetical protein
MVDQSLGKLDEIVKRAMRQAGVPGISVAVVFDDQVLATALTNSAFKATKQDTLTRV